MLRSLRVLLLFFSVIFLRNEAFGQATINSPFSRFGVGDLQPVYFGQARALGGAATGLREYNSINFSNPASYSAIRFTTLESGTRFSITTLQNETDRQRNFNAQYSYLALGFPVSKRASISFGLIPFSNMGYSQSQTTSGYAATGSLGSQTKTYTGEGGLTQGYLGLGYSITKEFSIGANVSYIFGNLHQTQALEFPGTFGNADTVLNGRNDLKESLGGFSLSYGAQYTKMLGKTTRLTVGYSGNLETQLITRVNSHTERYYKAGPDNETVIDRYDSINNGKNFTYLPFAHHLGVSLHIKDKFLFTADGNYGRWTGFSFNNQNAGFSNSYSGAAGIQYTPDITSVSNYLALVDYRLGGNYGKSYLNINGNPVKEYAVTAGLGIPIRSYTYNQVGSKINLSFEYGQRGNVTRTLVRERYFNIHLGFVLNQAWFLRTRYQ